jgi:hypothetical protein
MKWLAVIFAVCIASVASAGELRVYETPYYVLHTDLEPELARQVGLRMTRMAEEYAQRTRDFSGAIRERMPFSLYSRMEDYLAAGGMRGSAGFFNGKELVAVAGRLDAQTWHRVQHEGFHQFARMVIGGQIPAWANEGLADYFGEGLFTGDSFVTGVVPPWRLKRVQHTIQQGRFLSLTDMMQLSLQQWNAELNLANYDQAWSMVHFLAHGENGRYQRAFASFIQQIGRGKSWQEAWQQTFGDAAGFEQRWRTFWTELPENPTADLYVKVNVATWTSYLARAFSQKQTFATFDALIDAANKKQLKSHEEDWLPPSLLAEAIATSDRYMKEGHRFELVTSERLTQLRCTMPDGRRVTGKFSIRNERVGTVNVQIEKPTSRPARVN